MRRTTTTLRWQWSFQSAKATLSDAELKLFIHGDQKSIDFSAPPSLLSEQVKQTKRKWELSFFWEIVRPSWTNTWGHFISSFQIYLLPYDTSIEFPIDRKVWRETACLSLVLTPNKSPLISWDCALHRIYNRLTIGKQIGAGAYGRVLEGVAFGKIILCILYCVCIYIVKVCI